MAQVLIRNLDDELVSQLKREAEGKGLSLEAHLRAILDQRRKPSREQAIAEIKAIVAKVRPPARGAPSAADLVREGREERTRRVLGQDE